ncbi:MAG: hypothetical protein M3N93_11790 [Acidobacteriota bacterium]|nr:hypothetical protein [Acidobacteriota bacterium]
MKRTIKNNTAVIAYLNIISICSAASPTGLQSLADNAGSIVIATIDNVSFDGELHHLQFHVVLAVKGDLFPGTVLAANFRPTGPKKAGRIVGGIPHGNVLLFMNQDKQGSWYLLTLGPPALGLSATYFTIADGALAMASQLKSKPPADIVAELMAATIEADTSQGLRFLSIVKFDDAPSIFNSWSSAASPALKSYGLAARISSAQDVNAVTAATTLALTRSDAIFLSSAISGYRNPDARGVIAIGRFSTEAGADPQVILNCAYALAAIHSKESVSYLIRLLDNSNPLVDCAGELVTI